jgi:hypothetical protein
MSNRSSTASHCGAGSVRRTPSIERSQEVVNFCGVQVDASGPSPYCQLNTLLDASLPPGVRNYWKSIFFAELSEPE